MSQVLSGILGVLLFILLALAGAVLLGQRFQDSANNGRATAAVQAVSEAVKAANLYNAQEGVIPKTMQDLLAAGYLKSAPANPTGIEDLPEIVTVGSGAGAFRAVAMDLGGNAEDICTAIQRQTYGPEAEVSKSAPNGQTGCYKSSDAPTFTVIARI